MRIFSRSRTETINLGRRLARFLAPGDIIGLFGGLGSGKTVLAKGIAKGLGIDKERVVSPSFVLVREYPGRIPLYHFDLYRLAELRGIFRLGVEEYLYDEGITVIEWADRLKNLLPEQYLQIKLYIKDKHSRLIEIVPHGESYKMRFKAFNRQK